VLRRQIERKIKDRRFVDVMMQFAEYGQPVGIPIGNLLSQMYALIYLNPLDHFIKRELGAENYCRYVDDFVIFGWPRERCVEVLADIQEFLDRELSLELSRYSLHRVKRGINFVGYRTWRSCRFIRKHSLFKFSRAVKSGSAESAISILGHASRTRSFQHLLQLCREKNHDLYRKLPPHFRSRYQPTRRCHDPRSVFSR
jgi:hypothetical protein